MAIFLDLLEMLQGRWIRSESDERCLLAVQFQPVSYGSLGDLRNTPSTEREAKRIIGVVAGRFSCDLRLHTVGRDHLTTAIMIPKLDLRLAEDWAEALAKKLFADLGLESTVQVGAKPVMILTTQGISYS